MDKRMLSRNNIKLFPIYKMFAWDLLFYYAISFLFLTQVKSFTASEILFADAFYPVFRIISQIICVNITDLLGKQKSLILGNVLVSASILFIILGNNLSILIFSFFIQAVGYNFKTLCEPTILSDSIPHSNYSSNVYSKFDATGNTLFYILDSIFSIIAGFLFVVNPYIPMVMCFVFCLISTIICLSFNEIPSDSKTDKVHTSFILYFKDTLITFKQIIKSGRLRCLLIFSACLTSLLLVFPTLRSSLLMDIGLPEQYFGIIVAAMQIISSFTSKKQKWFHKTFKNRALSWFALPLVTSFIITGLLVICNINFKFSLMASLLTIIIVGIIKGPYYSLITRYFNSFSNPSVNTKIFAVKSLLENIVRMILSLFASFLLSVTTTGYSFVIIGCILFVLFIFLLDYMKTKVGLKPEEYPEEDLIFSIDK